MSEAATPPNPSSPTEKAQPRCPECGEELDYLECYTTAKYEYDGETFEYIEMVDGWEDTATTSSSAPSAMLSLHGASRRPKQS
jgi:hypothetical protein